MNRTRTKLRTRAKGATIPEDAAIEVIRDIDSAIARRDLVSLRAFGREAELSGLDAEGARAREIANLLEASSIESKANDTPARPRRPAPPTQAQLVARFDAEQLAAMGRGGPFDVNTFEATERERVEEQNRQLAERNRRHEEQRRRQVGKPQAEPWWRR